MKRFLFVSTSFLSGSLSLLDEDKVTSKVWKKERSHSESITLYLNELLSTSCASLNQIDAIVCTNGPGSFTGIRIGLSVARSLAYVFKKPLLTLTDCFALSLSATPSKDSVITILDAQKNKVFFSEHVWENSLCWEKIAPCLMDPVDVLPHLENQRSTLLGNGLHLVKPLLQDNQNGLSFLEDPQPLSVALAEYFRNPSAQTQFQFQNWQQAHPLYIRKSSAEEVWEAKGLLGND